MRVADQIVRALTLGSCDVTRLGARARMFEPRKRKRKRKVRKVP